MEHSQRQEKHMAIQEEFRYLRQEICRLGNLLDRITEGQPADAQEVEKGQPINPALAGFLHTHGENLLHARTELQDYIDKLEEMLF